MSAQAEFDFEARREEAKQASAAVIERIKKLLSVAADKRGNRHEAEEAMRLAFELAEKYRVNIESLDLDEKAAGLMHEHFDLGLRFDRLRRGVFGVLTTYFHVTVCLQPPRMLVIGKEADVMIARYVHDFLLRAGRNCLSEYTATEKSARRKVTTAKRAGYLAGFIYGIHAKLSASRKTMPLTDSQTALVVAEAAQREHKLDEMIPKRSKVKELTGRKNPNSVTAGFHDGRSTEINKPLAGTPGTTLLLT